MACCSYVKHPGQVAKRNTSFQYCLTVDYNHRNAITILLKEFGIAPNIDLSQFIGSLCSDIIKHISCFFAQVTSGLRIECHLCHRWFVSSAHLCGSVHCFSLDLCASYHVAYVPANKPQASQGYSTYPFGPTRSLIGGTLEVSQVNARQPSFQPSSIVASIE